LVAADTDQRLGRKESEHIDYRLRLSPEHAVNRLRSAVLPVRRPNPNPGAGALDKPDRPEAVEARDLIVGRASEISHEAALRDLTSSELKERLDEWTHEAGKGGRNTCLRKEGAEPCHEGCAPQEAGHSSMG